jgi:hypothetical protein
MKEMLGIFDPLLELRRPRGRSRSKSALRNISLTSRPGRVPARLACALISGETFRSREKIRRNLCASRRSKKSETRFSVSFRKRLEKNNPIG